LKLSSINIKSKNGFLFTKRHKTPMTRLNADMDSRRKVDVETDTQNSHIAYGTEVPKPTIKV
jgi:hypothetical protein